VFTFLAYSVNKRMQEWQKFDLRMKLSLTNITSDDNAIKQQFVVPSVLVH